MSADSDARLVVVGLVVVGVVQLALHPRRTWALLVHGRGWYE